MNESTQRTPQPSDLELQLAALRPQSSNFDRDGLMYQAGREAALREVAMREVSLREVAVRGAARRWLWPSAAGLMAAAASVMAVMLVIGQQPVVEVQTVYVDRPAEAAAPAIVRQSPAEGSTASQVTSESKSAPARRSWVERPSRGMIHARDMALAFGVDALPTGMSSRGQAAGGGGQSVASLRAELSGHPAPANRDDGDDHDSSSGDWLPQVLAWPLGM